MAETSKNKIYYNDNEDNIADVLADMKKLAESTDNAIEGAKYDDTELKKKNETQDEEIVKINKKDTTQDNLIEELQTENTKLKKTIESMQIPGEEVGNPIHLSDSSDMECEIVPIGNAEQETREGYNILPSSEWSGRTYSHNGVDFEVLKDGGISIKGELTSTTADGLIKGNWGNTTELFEFEEGENYTLQLVDNNNSKIKAFLINVNAVIVNTSTYNTFSTTLNPTMFFVRVTGSIGDVIDTIVYPQIIKGSETKPYEQYGAMPSPNYPSKVVTVGQNVNIFDKDNVNKINAWIDNSGYFQYSSDFKVLYIQCDKNKDYVVSSKYLRGIAFLNEVPKTGLTSTNFKIQNATELTLNSQDNTYLAVWYYATASGLTEQEILDSIKIVEGTEVGGYSPYGQGSVEIGVVNKNYLNFLNKSGNASGLDYSCNKNAINLNGTPSTSYDIRNIIETTKLKAGTYTFSANIGKFSISNSCQFHFRDKYNNAIVTLNLWGTGYKKTVTFEDDIEIDGKMSYFYTNKNVVFSQDKFVLQIELGTVATEPVEHESYTKVLPIQKEFVKIGDVEDTFVKVDGKWYEEHYHPKIVFDGSDDEGWYISSTFKNVFVANKPDNLASGTTNLLCNKSKNFNISGNYLDTVDNGIVIGGKINFKDVSCSTLEEFIAKCQTNNLVLYYLLATPELIPCTEEQEEILNSFYTYKGVTNVSMSGIGTLKVKYKKDLETIINNLATATVALGGNINV